MLYGSNITAFLHPISFYLLYCTVVYASSVYVITNEYLALTVMSWK